jgi:hypothetical protein
MIVLGDDEGRQLIGMGRVRGEAIEERGFGEG